MSKVFGMTVECCCGTTSFVPMQGSDLHWSGRDVEPPRLNCFLDDDGDFQMGWVCRGCGEDLTYFVNPSLITEREERKAKAAKAAKAKAKREAKKAEAKREAKKAEAKAGRKQ